MRKRLRLPVYLLIFVFLVTGCGQTAIAMVNGERITFKKLNAKIEQTAALYGYDLASEEAKEVKEFLQEYALEELIQETVLLQNAKKEGISCDKKELNKQLKEYKERFADKEEYKQHMKEFKLTEKDIRDLLSSTMIIDSLFTKVTASIKETTQNPQKYYNENKEAFLVPEQRQVRHILTQTEAEARDVIKQLDKGTDFVKLVLEKSISPDKEDGGLFEFFTEDVDFEEEFINAAFKIKEVGDYTNTPVRTVYGYHIIKLEGLQKERMLPFEEVKTSLEGQLLLQEKSLRFEEYTNDLLEKAKIVVNLPTTNPPEAKDGDDVAVE